MVAAVLSRSSRLKCSHMSAEFDLSAMFPAQVEHRLDHLARYFKSIMYTVLIWRAGGRPRNGDTAMKSRGAVTCNRRARAPAIQSAMSMANRPAGGPSRRFVEARPRGPLRSLCSLSQSGFRSRSLAWAGGRLSPCRCFHRRRKTDRRHRIRALTRLFQAAYQASPGPFPSQDLSA